MPEVSVLMGTYNDNRMHAAQAVDSMLAQTFTDFELIICDDGSDAAYLDWLSSYCRKDARIRLFYRRKNHGLAAALNCCFAQASGKYIARMDADDISRPDRLKKQTDFLRQYPEYAFVGSSARLVGARGVWGVRRMEEIPQKKSFLSTSPFIHPSVMFRREILEASGGYCELPRCLRTEDYELFMRLYALGWTGYNLQETLLDYREDWKSYEKRKYCFRLRECRVRFCGFRELGILPGNVRYALKPLLVGMIPRRAAQQIRRRRFAVHTDRAETGDLDCIL